MSSAAAAPITSAARKTPGPSRITFLTDIRLNLLAYRSGLKTHARGAIWALPVSCCSKGVEVSPEGRREFRLVRADDRQGEVAQAPPAGEDHAPLFDPVALEVGPGPIDDVVQP